MKRFFSGLSRLWPLWLFLGAAALALAAYLRALGLAPLPCCAGGLAFAFAGYNFTLFNAGYRGYFNMMPYAVLLFALIERAVRKPSAAGFALMGAGLDDAVAKGS